MIKCPNCDSERIKILEAFGDGNDHIDVQVKCKECGAVHWITVRELELPESERTE